MALENLQVIEKQTRLAADLTSNARILGQMATLCYSSDNLEKLAITVSNLTKKRGIIKESVSQMLRLIIGWAESNIKTAFYLDSLSITNILLNLNNIKYKDDKKLKDSKVLIDIARVGSEGKVYAEAERADASRLLAVVLEVSGDINGAADILTEVPIETFGSVGKLEKTEFVLEQIRLALASGHPQKATIMSRKLTMKTFEAPGFEYLRLRFLRLLVELALIKKDYRLCSGYYKTISEIEPDMQLAEDALRLAVVFAVLTPAADDLIKALSSEPRISGAVQGFSMYRDLLQTFIVRDIVRWPAVEAAFGAELHFKFPHIFGVFQQIKDSNLDSDKNDSARRWADLKQRVIEYNIRLISTVYTRIHLHRMAQLLDMTIEDTESKLCELLSAVADVSKEKSPSLWARIDRNTQIVTFTPISGVESLLKSWDSRINSIATILSQTTHQIAKEEMLAQTISK